MSSPNGPRKGPSSRDLSGKSRFKLPPTASRVCMPAPSGTVKQGVEKHTADSAEGPHWISPLGKQSNVAARRHVVQLPLLYGSVLPTALELPRPSGPVQLLTRAPGGVTPLQQNGRTRAQL
ncbi:hypothetical protein NDU88_006235 [Pleurodeles waltl]|uniref:Uncharacterized protein n=1 Tax=Pleurodeles waltl TaxID=8319 RepID=A0AAV7QH15_PLEWA|nr:hypothetical protein NDU88_006235 [Pleurodeles waltl]